MSHTNITYRENVLIVWGGYNVRLRVQYQPAFEPEVVEIEFLDQLVVEDLQFDTDINIGVDDTMSDVLLRYRSNAHIGSEWLHEVIEQAI